MPKTDREASVSVTESTTTGLKVNQTTTSILQDNSISPASNGRMVTSIRGLDDPSRSTKTFGEIVRGSSLSEEHKEKLALVWRTAQINGRNVGLDIKDLMPMLERQPELIEKLNTVAKTNCLFGIDRSRVSEQAFEAMRREFLVGVIRGAVMPSLLTQGEANACTSKITLQSISIPPERMMKIALDLAIAGRAVTAGGDELLVSRTEKELYDKRIPFAEKKSGLSLSGDGSLSRQVGSASVSLPPLGMVLVYSSIMNLTGVDPSKDVGQSCEGYTQIVRSLSGLETACAARDAMIPVDSSNQPVTDPRRAVRALTQIQYLDATLARIAGRSVTAGQRSGLTDFEPRGVLIDSQWMDANPSSSGERRHGRHALLATELKRHEDGLEYYTLENPLGDTVMGKQSSGDPTRFYPPGSELGDKRSIWWKTGENGIVYVQKDVIEKNLVTLMVQYNEHYDGSNPTPVRLLGTLEPQKTTYKAPILFVVPESRQTDPSSLSDKTNNPSGQATEQDRPTLAGVAMAQQAEARRKNANQAGEPSADPTYLAVVKSAKRQDGDEIDEILARYDQGQDRTRKPPSNEKLYASFTSSVPSAATVASSVTPPPPPPQESPADRAAKQRQGVLTTAA
jgi:hypothetical protein